MFLEKKKKEGFTIIELIVSVALFSFVSVGAIGAMIAVVDGNKKARSLVQATDSLGFALESMTRELRVGSAYSCDGAGDCAPGGPGPGTSIEFQTSEGSTMIYRINANRLERCGSPGIDCAGSYLAMTGNDVFINSFDVYVQGSLGTPGDTEQPRATLIITGTSGGDPDTDSQFTIQSTVAQRFPDF